MKRRSGALAVMACAAALAAGTAVAEEVKVTVVKGAALDDMKVTKDRNTGRLRPATPEEIQALSRGTGSFGPSVVVQSRPETTVIHRADGSGVVRRSLEDLDNLVVNRDAKGRLVLRHGDRHSPATPAALPKE